ncbi:hypothetical protein GCK72_000904 [Caenorhabditis remanei]|uniref:Uncharacterized protein n=1 Tax=Caenorhabditis remanei TaxID=31234 RepID=A0A6A5HPD7_CAERE|nr:hypothetical protein GCK72_000904 [Caenorhabditis remanei]KAF1769091.1 hypothetical protein GCK72_000904 [Caenorhabditis remanei]
MVYTRRKRSVKSHENEAATSTKVLKSGRGKANKAMRSGANAVRETERENEKDALKTGLPEVVEEMRTVTAADSIEDDMEEIAAPYSSSNRRVDSPVYENLENVRHEELLSANVKGEYTSTPKGPKSIPPPRFIKKENYSTSVFCGTNEESTSHSSSFSNGLRDYHVPVTPSQPCPTPSYSNRVKPFQSETGVRERQTHFSTNNNTWDPVGFSANNLYDLTTGIPLPRLECEENLKKLDKNVLNTDFYPFLQIAQRFHNVNRDMEMLALGQAFNVAMLNKMTARLRQAEKTNAALERESDIIKGVGFDLKRAAEVEKDVELPCRKIVKLSSIVTAVEASKWTSSRFFGDSRNLMRFVYKEIAKRDAFFAGYSAQDSSNKGYVAFGDKFYRPIVDFVVAGFRQPRDVNTLTTLHCAAREAMINLLDRFRKEYKEKMESTAKEVADTLKDHLFRLSLVEDGLYQEALDLTDISTPHADFICLK